MGQAQRSDRRGSDDRIRVIAGNGSRSSAGERARRRGTERGGLEGLELWEISRDNDNSRMMRLADREQVRLGQGRPRPRTQPNRRNTGNPRPVSSIKRRRARKRRLNLYRIFVFLMIGVCLILIYQTDRKSVV